MSKKSVLADLAAKFDARHPVHPDSPFAQFMRGLQAVSSERPVRPVVTPFGRRARGHVPARKSIGKARFESLLEQNVWRVLDTASSVRSFMTHPVVLRLNKGGGGAFHYTPDAVVRVGDVVHGDGVVLEVKARFFLMQDVTRQRTQTIARALNDSGLQYALLLDTDLNDDFIETLNALWHQRPAMGRWGPDKDPDAWDVRGRTIPVEQTAAAWTAAKAECDALLQRVMHRDPGDVDELLQLA